MVVIVLELTNSYTFALASLVGLAISVGYVQVRFGSSLILMYSFLIEALIFQMVEQVFL